MALRRSEAAALTRADPSEVARRLKVFDADADSFSTDHDKLLKRFPKRWVALYGGEVIATGRRLDVVLRAIDRQRLARQDVLVRFLDEDGQVLVL